MLDGPSYSKLSELPEVFADLVRRQQLDLLDPWLQQANESETRIWRSFAEGLEQDKSAVRNALIYGWSNGPTEGHVNRLKCLKCQIYGRAKDDLLRKRLLWQGKLAFT